MECLLVYGFVKKVFRVLCSRVGLGHTHPINAT